MSGKPSPDNPASESTLIENLRNSIKLLEDSNIVGLIEPINNVSVPGYFLNNFEMGETCLTCLTSVTCLTCLSGLSGLFLPCLFSHV